MELRAYFQLLARRWLVLALTALVGVGIAYMSTDRAARYESSALLLVSPERFSLETEGANISFDRIAVIDRLLLTYSRMIQSDTVAGGAVDRLGIDRSADAVAAATQADVIIGTQLLRVTVRDTSPATARDLANAVARAFIDAVNANDGSTSETGAIPGGVPVTVFEPASVPPAPLDTGLIGNMLLGGIFGLIVATGVCIAVDALDVTVRSVRDTERKLGLPVVGTIPVLRNPQQLLARTQAELGAARTHGREEGLPPPDPTIGGPPPQETARA